MSIIKQISVFNGNSWDTDNIGANAGNIELLSSDGSTASTVAGSTNLLTGLTNILPINALTASRALISDGNGKISTSSVTSTQLGRLSGVTSSVQTQINNINTLIGNTSITGIGGGTVTGAISVLNENVMSSNAGVITSTMSSGTVRDKSVVRSGRNLNILFFVTDASAPATGNIATLPEGYRPQGVRYLMGEIIVNGSRIPMRFNVDINGKIAISYGNVTMTQVEIAGTIPV